jgi:hypothetical protein
MTIRFLNAWNGYDDQDIATLSSAEESRLVGLGLATYTIRAERSAPATDNMVFESLADIPAGVVGPVWDNAGIPYYGNMPEDRITTIVIGNSIAAQAAYGTGNGIIGRAQSHHLNTLLCNSPLWFPVTTSDAGEPGVRGIVSTRGDYGFGGATVAGILADLQVTFFPQLDRKNIIPKLVLLNSLFENDIGGSTDSSMPATYAATQALITLIQAKWPGVKISLAGCRPSFSINNAIKVANYNALHNWLLGLQSKDILVWIPTGTGQPDAPWLPAITRLNGSISGATLTVNSVTGAPLEYGSHLIVNNNQDNANIISFGTGLGGAGTYTLNGAVTGYTSATDIDAAIYTDHNVHPNDKGAWVYARQEKAVVERLIGNASTRFRSISENWNLIGTNATPTGGNAVGTLPTETTAVGNTNCTQTFLAMNPGLRVTFTAFAASTIPLVLVDGTAGITFSDYFTIPAEFTRIRAFRPRMRCKIIEGAEHISLLQYRPRFTDNGTDTNYNPRIQQSSHRANAVLENGEELYFSWPEIVSGLVGTFITRFRQGFVIWAKPGTPADARIVMEFYEAGYDLPDGNSGLITLVGGTATVPAGLMVMADSEIQLDRITAAGTPGALFVSAKTVGTSFVITSTNASDTSIVKWAIR